MRVQQYGREVRHYGKCWAQDHGQWDRRILEVVVPADWLPLLDVRRALQVTHRSNPTQEAKATTAKMPTAGLGVGVPATDAAPCVLEGGEQEPSLRGLELAEGGEPDPHRLRPANNAALNNLAQALIKRSGKFATVPQGMAHYTANREAGLEALVTRQKGNAAGAAGQPSGPGAVWSGMGEICLRDCPGRARRGMARRASGGTPAAGETVSGPPCSSFREGSVGYPEPFREPNESTLGSGIGRQRGISSCRKSKPRRGRRARSRLSRQ